jgi:hypothetical protein
VEAAPTDVQAAVKANMSALNDAGIKAVITKAKEGMDAFLAKIWKAQPDTPPSAPTPPTPPTNVTPTGAV